MTRLVIASHKIGEKPETLGRGFFEKSSESVNYRNSQENDGKPRPATANSLPSLIAREIATLGGISATNGRKTMQTYCPKCEGKGRIELFGNVSDGRCFNCRGTGQVAVSLFDFLAGCGDRDVIRKVSWMFSADADAIDSLGYEILERVRQWVTRDDAATGRFSFVYGIWCEKFAAVYESKRAEFFDAAPKPF